MAQWLKDVGTGVLTSAAGSAMDFGFGQIASAQQWNRTKKMMKNRWQWQAEDMRKAGLNPILGLSGGAPAMGAVPSAAIGQSNVAAGVSSASQARRMNKLLDSEIEKNYALAGQAQATGFNQTEQGQNADKIGARLDAEAELYEKYPELRWLGIVGSDAGALGAGAAAAYGAYKLGKRRGSVKTNRMRKK